MFIRTGVILNVLSKKCLDKIVKKLRTFASPGIILKFPTSTSFGLICPLYYGLKVVLKLEQVEDESDNARFKKLCYFYGNLLNNVRAGTMYIGISFEYTILHPGSIPAETLFFPRGFYKAHSNSRGKTLNT